ncbi:MAG: GntP family permease, partial [Fusobacteriaceae bacterium]|nr:GntP family permease [Fusobacteriaceae bacterium]
MNTQQLISLIGIIVALSLLIWMIMKGVNIFITVFISCAIVGITTLGFVADEKVGPLTMFNAYKTFFIRGFVGFFSANYLIFLTGTLMGKLMEITNGAKAIAKLIIKIFGK